MATFRPKSPPLSFFFFLLCLVLHHSALAQPRPLQSVAFTTFLNAPSGWTKPSASSLTLAAPQYVRLPDAPREFRFALRADALTYVFSSPHTGFHTLRIGLIEPSACTPGRRVARYVVNGVTSRQIDIFSLAGCNLPLYIDITFFVPASRTITLFFAKQPRSWAPLISNFRLFRGRQLPEGYTPAPSIIPPTPPPSPTPISRAVDIVRNLGPRDGAPGATGKTFRGTGRFALNVDVAEENGIPENDFYTYIEGASFTLSFDIPPGVYDVVLGFAEIFSGFCNDQIRAFNVRVNGKLRLDSFNIFKQAGDKCRTAIVVTLPNQPVDLLNPQPLTVTFDAIAGLAIVSYIRVRSSADACTVRPLDDDVNEDHLAHSVPGEYPSNGDPFFVDRTGRGSVTVAIDGSRSHTHFSNSGVNGKLISYTWLNVETGQVIATTPTFNYRFGIGTTRLRLTVVDDACSIDDAETKVTVTGAIVPGVYCYFYEGLRSLLEGGTLARNPLPGYSQSFESLTFGFPTELPFYRSQFVMRCLFFIDFDAASRDTRLSIVTDGTGEARVYQGSDLVIDSSTSLRSGPLTTLKGLGSYEVIYRRTDLVRDAVLSVMVNDAPPTTLMYDRLGVRPIITSVDPAFGRVEGGERLTISGYGLFLPLTVRFGRTNARAIDDETASSTRVSVIAPASTEEQTVDLSVRSSNGLTSGVLKYLYGSLCDPVAFDAVVLRDSSNNPLNIPQATAVTVWQDGRLYVGTRSGVVYVVTYDRTSLVATSTCYSSKITDSRFKDKEGRPSERAILGITFDPRDTVGRPYVTASSLFWGREDGSIAAGNWQSWMNGNVERLRPSTRATLTRDPRQCLQYDRNIVRNLPVSNADHSVNELLFTDDGDLIIGVGGNTNAGLPAASLGSLWETYFSGAVVIAHVNRPGFDGVIRYSRARDYVRARPQTEDVELYATGVRNLFSLTMARDGKIFGTDMGANCKFGNVSSSCDEYNRTLSRELDDDWWPGLGVAGPEGDCKYGDGRQDRLVEILPGKYYGHSNLQRGQMINSPGECVWVDPDTDKGTPPADIATPRNYMGRVAQLRSASTGVVEYGGNLFCGKLRNDLIVSSYLGFRTWRVRKDDGGGISRQSDVGLLERESALRVVENHHGDLVLVGYADGIGVRILRPKVVRDVGVVVVNAVPVRHGRAGGSLLHVGGWGFVDGVEVRVAGRRCPVVSRESRELVCRVPAARAGVIVAGVVVQVGAARSALPDALRYMNV